MPFRDGSWKPCVSAQKLQPMMIVLSFNPSRFFFRAPARASRHLQLLTPSTARLLLSFTAIQMHRHCAQPGKNSCIPCC